MATKKKALKKASKKSTVRGMRYHHYEDATPEEYKHAKKTQDVKQAFKWLAQLADDFGLFEDDQDVDGDDGDDDDEMDD